MLTEGPHQSSVLWVPPADDCAQKAAVGANMVLFVAALLHRMCVGIQNGPKPQS